jgi:SAM-dependent methyltransferase
MQEVEFVLALSTNISSSSPETVLEVGCGTGNHSLEFSRYVKSLTAVELDPAMYAIAAEKTRHLRNVIILPGDIEEIQGMKFDLATALFNVITYIPDTPTMTRFFENLHRLLKDGSLFVFDCWNGDAALHDPPKRKSVSLETECNQISCEIEVENNLPERWTDLIYSLHVVNKETGLEERGIYQMRQFLWSPKELKKLLLAAGFCDIEMFPPFLPGRASISKDWKLMVTARA